MADLPLKAAILPVTPYQQNCSLVWCTKTNRAALIDPGGEVERLKAAVAAEGLTLEKVLLTHGHLDHTGNLARLKGDAEGGVAFGHFPGDGAHSFIFRDFALFQFRYTNPLHPFRLQNANVLLAKDVTLGQKLFASWPENGCGKYSPRADGTAGGNSASPRTDVGAWAR